MSYLLRFTQHYKPESQAAFLAIEAKFAALERSTPNFPQGRRYQPLAGREPNQSLIWECELPSLADVERTLSQLSADPTHTGLFNQQVAFITEMRTEIFTILDLRS